MHTKIRPLLAECLGTFFLVFAAVGAIVSDTYRNGSIGLLGIAAAQGLALAVAVSMTMNISGGHLNPAVTIGAWSVGRIGLKDAASYIGAQLVGAILAATAVKLLYPGGATSVAVLGTPQLAIHVDLARGILIEAILTFLLGLAVMGTAVDPAAPKIAGFGIGLVMWFDILAGGQMTGAAVNPARAFGPALVTQLSGNAAWAGHAAYWIGPILGAVAAFQVYERLLLKRDG